MTILLTTPSRFESLYTLVVRRTNGYEGPKEDSYKSDTRSHHTLSSEKQETLQKNQKEPRPLPENKVSTE